MVKIRVKVTFVPVRIRIKWDFDPHPYHIAWYHKSPIQHHDDLQSTREVHHLGSYNSCVSQSWYSYLSCSSAGTHIHSLSCSHYLYKSFHHFQVNSSLYLQCHLKEGKRTNKIRVWRVGKALDFPPPSPRYRVKCVGWGYFYKQSQICWKI